MSPERRADPPFLLVGDPLDRCARVPRLLREARGPTLLVASPSAARSPLARSLLDALRERPGSALALSRRSEPEPESEPAGSLPLTRLLLHPADLAPVAIRAEPLRSLRLPPLAPPDLVAANAWAWLLAVALAARGVEIAGVPAPPRPRTPPAHPDALTPSGRAWLIECALALVPDVALTPALCRDLIARARVPALPPHAEHDP